MAKLDIKHAFRLCPVHPADLELLGIHWEGQYYIDLRLPLACAPPHTSLTVLPMLLNGFLKTIT